MTDLALRPPLAAGGAALEATGNAIHWGFAQYMRAPLGNTAVLALVTLAALAGSNALYFQTRHPAPLFAPETAAVAFAVAEPVVPAVRTQPQPPAAASAEVATGSLAPPSDAATPLVLPLDNAEVLEIQRRLHDIGLYEGALDGLFGPRTAAAIRAFESAQGLPPRGELTRGLLEAVRAAKPVAQATLAVTPASTPPAATSPDAAFRPTPDQPKVVADLPPLPPPTPLDQTLAAPAEATASPPALFESEPRTIEDVITGVTTMAMTSPGDGGEGAQDPSLAEPILPEPMTTGSVASAVPAPIPVLDTDASPEHVMPFSATNAETIARVQRGLASLGFLHGPADGVFGEATAKAIRNFEVYYSYGVTGRISPELIDLLVRYGATI